MCARRTKARRCRRRYARGCRRPLPCLTPRGSCAGASQCVLSGRNSAPRTYLLPRRRPRSSSSSSSRSRVSRRPSGARASRDCSEAEASSTASYLLSSTSLEVLLPPVGRLLTGLRCARFMRRFPPHLRWVSLFRTALSAVSLSTVLEVLSAFLSAFRARSSARSLLVVVLFIYWPRTCRRALLLAEVRHYSGGDVSR